MNKVIALLILMSAGILTSCGDDHMVRDSGSSLHQYVYAVPDRQTGNIAGNYAPLGDLYVEQEQTVKFYAGYSIGDQIYTDESLQQYYEGLTWKIGDEYYNLNSFRYTFQETGPIDGLLETVDQYGDTLRNQFHIYVNTPNSVELNFPYDGYNQADPSSEQPQSLQWTVHGIDPWEEAYCQVFISYHPESVWETPIGGVDCNSSILLSGGLASIEALHDNEYVTRDSSFTLYWGVKVISKNAHGKQYRDSSEIFHFSTRIQNDSSIVKIPIVHNRYQSSALLQTQIHLISAQGDTLKTIVNTDIETTISTKVAAQSGLKIYVQEMYRKEFAPESLMIDVPAQTVIETDTVLLDDKVSPQVAPFLTVFSPAEDLQFLIYDDGAGINPSRIKVIFDNDTLPSTYSEPTLYFRKTCETTCTIKITGEDFAHNSLPQVHWILKNKISAYVISGPFANEEP